MVVEKMEFVKHLLEEYEYTRTDGHGKFLNLVYFKLYGNATPNFLEFVPETWTRARRKVMEKYPHLDNRTSKTKEAEVTIKKEMK